MAQQPAELSPDKLAYLNAAHARNIEASTLRWMASNAAHATKVGVGEHSLKAVVITAAGTSIMGGVTACSPPGPLGQEAATVHLLHVDTKTTPRINTENIKTALALPIAATPKAFGSPTPESLRSGPNSSASDKSAPVKRTIATKPAAPQTGTIMVELTPHDTLWAEINKRDPEHVVQGVATANKINGLTERAQDLGVPVEKLDEQLQVGEPIKIPVVKPAEAADNSIHELLKFVRMAPGDTLSNNIEKVDPERLWKDVATANKINGLTERAQDLGVPVEKLDEQLQVGQVIAIPLQTAKHSTSPSHTKIPDLTKIAKLQIDPPSWLHDTSTSSDQTVRDHQAPVAAKLLRRVNTSTPTTDLHAAHVPQHEIPHGEQAHKAAKINPESKPHRRQPRLLGNNTKRLIVNRCITAAMALPGNTDQEMLKKEYQYFVCRGDSTAEAAGIMGNIQQESSGDPQKIEGGSRSTNPNDAGARGYGLVQYTPGYKIFSEMRKYHIKGPVDKVLPQLNLIWAEEHGTSPTGVQNMSHTLDRQSTPADAASYFTTAFEGPSIIGPRKQYAQEIQNAFAKGALKALHASINSVKREKIYRLNLPNNDFHTINSKASPSQHHSHEAQDHVSTSNRSFRYIWPFATKNEAQQQRVDQGKDLISNPGADIYALTDGTLLESNPDPIGGFGNDYPTELLSSTIPGMPSKYIYYGHVHMLPNLIGKFVKAGQLIAHANTYYGQNGSKAPAGWIEMGFAKSQAGDPVAAGSSGSSTAGYTMQYILNHYATALQGNK